MRLENIIEIDQQLMQSINNGSSPFFDGCISVFATPYIWIPTLIVVLYVLLKNNNLKEFITITLLLVLMLAATSALVHFAIEPLFNYIYKVSVSSNNAINILKSGTTLLLINSANAFAVAIFLSMLIRHKALTISLFIWAAIGCYTGLNMLVSYPMAVLSGVFVGALCGFVCYRLLKSLLKKQHTSRRDWISDRFTKSGYEVPDIYLLLVFLYGTLAIIPTIYFIVN